MATIAFHKFYEIAGLIFIPTLLIIGAVHFFVSILSFRVFSCSLKTFFIPCVAAILGILWSILHVLIWACSIAAIYVSFELSMSIYEAVAFVVAIAGVLIFLSTGFANRIYLPML